MNESVERGHSVPIPHFSDLRRVPMRYREILPLPILKHYHCLVVGSAPGVLTIAITKQDSASTLQALQQYTGKAIFPVLIDKKRMRLLLWKLERSLQCTKRCSSEAGWNVRHTYSYQRVLIRLQIGVCIQYIQVKMRGSKSG